VTKIEIRGFGGMGVKLISLIFSKIMDENGNQVSTVIDYAPAVSGAAIIGKITYSDEKIENPVFENADVFIELNRDDCMLRFNGKESKINLHKIAVEKFGNPLVMNMLVLGIILKKSGMEKYDARKYLPEIHMEENIKAIDYGHNEIKGI